MSMSEPLATAVTFNEDQKLAASGVWNRKA